MSPEEISELLNKKSGLLGVSGSGGDMRDLLNKSPGDAHAAEAVELFCYRAKKYIGAYAAVLGGIDLLAFTGGIGEHAAPVRRENLRRLGISWAFNSTRHATCPTPRSFHRTGTRVKVRVIETNEDLMIVRHVRAALGWTRPQFPEVAMFVFDPKLSSVVESSQAPAEPDDRRSPDQSRGRSRRSCSTKCIATGKRQIF